MRFSFGSLSAQTLILELFTFKIWEKSGPIKEQNGVDLSFSRALPASIWGQCSQILVFTSTWGTQKGV